jgi:glycosyltransferase involved in cell wall biosynthesis
MPPKISVVLIVRNEAGHLRDCLGAARDVADEIVVVDTGSQDDTVAIAEAHADMIGHFVWCDDFSAARNHALGLATGDWILSLDADETILDPSTSRERLQAFAESAPAGTVGTVTMVQPVRHGDQEQVVKEPLPRFFPRAGFHYEGIIHEQVMSDTGLPTLSHTGVTVHHRGYALDPGAADAKSRRNLQLLRTALQRNPEDGYLLYQMGKTYFALRRYGMAAIYLERAWEELRAAEGLPESVLTDLATIPVFAYLNEDKADEANDWIATHVLADHPGTKGADFPHARGYAALLQGDYGHADRHFQEARDRGPDRELVAGTGSHTAAFHLGLLREARGQLRDALQHYADSLRLNTAFVSPAQRVAVCVTQEVDGATEVLAEANVDIAANVLQSALEEAGATDRAHNALQRAWAKAFPDTPWPL